MKLSKSTLSILLASSLVSGLCSVAVAENADAQNRRHIYLAQKRSSQKSLKTRNYVKYVEKRIQESWSTYNINSLRARIAVSINRKGEITSTKLINSTGADSHHLDQAIEAIKYATPFGAPPKSGKPSIKLTVNFRQGRVSIDHGSTSGAVAKSRSKASKSQRVSRVSAKSKISTARKKKTIPPVSNPFGPYPTGKRYNTDSAARELLDYLSH